MHHILLIGLCGLVLLMSCSAPGPASLGQKLKQVTAWSYYLDHDDHKNRDAAAKLLQLDMAVIDPDHRPPMGVLRSKPLLLLGYISAGEAESYRDYWPKVKGASYLLGENEIWAENFLVDVRDQAWHDLLLDQEIPRVLAMGFDGIFLDTLDTAVTLASDDAQKYPGAFKGMTDLIGKIRAKYPDILIMSNNGFPMLLDLAPNLDGVVVEDVWSMYDGKGYRQVEEEVTREKIQILAQVQARHKLPVFSVDYLGKNQIPLGKTILKNAHNHRFIPYLAQSALNDVYDQARYR